MNIDEEKVIDEEKENEVISEENNTMKEEKKDWLEDNEVYVVEPTKEQIMMAKTLDVAEKTVKGVNKVRRIIAIILNVLQPICFVVTIGYALQTLLLAGVSFLTFFQVGGEKIQEYFAILAVLVGVNVLLVIVRFICSDLKTNIFNIVNIAILVLLFMCKGNILVSLLRLAIVGMLIFYNVAPNKWKNRNKKDED